MYSEQAWKLLDTQVQHHLQEFTHVKLAWEKQDLLNEMSTSTTEQTLPSVRYMYFRRGPRTETQLYL